MLTCHQKGPLMFIWGQFHINHWNKLEIFLYKIPLKSPRGQRVKIVFKFPRANELIADTYAAQAKDINSLWPSDAIQLHRSESTLGSGKGLSPDGTKSLPAVDKIFRSSIDIYLRTISQQVPQLLFSKFSRKITPKDKEWMESTIACKLIHWALLLHVIGPGDCLVRIATTSFASDMGTEWPKSY